MLFLLARLLRLASIAICAITLASFALFVINQTSTASAHQQRLLGGESAPAASAPVTAAPGAGTGGSAGGRQRAPGPSASVNESSLRRFIDEASNAFTSPFAGVISSTSEWTVRITRLLLALVVYGFGLGFLARVLRVRV